MHPFDFNGKTLTVTQTAPNGKVNRETLFHFRQNGRVVLAEYAGGLIQHGSLVGKLTDTTLEFRYAQIDLDGTLDGGHSVCRIEHRDGKIRLYENFIWESTEGSGTNIFDEI